MSYEHISAYVVAKLRTDTDNVEFEKDFHVVHWPMRQNYHTVFVDYMDLKWRIDVDFKDLQNPSVKITWFIQGIDFFACLLDIQDNQIACRYQSIHQATKYPQLIPDIECVVKAIMKGYNNCNVENFAYKVMRLVFELSDCYYADKCKDF